MSLIEPGFEKVYTKDSSFLFENKIVTKLLSINKEVLDYIIPIDACDTILTFNIVDCIYFNDKTSNVFNKTDDKTSNVFNKTDDKTSNVFNKSDDKTSNVFNKTDDKTSNVFNKTDDKRVVIHNPLYTNSKVYKISLDKTEELEVIDDMITINWESEDKVVFVVVDPQIEILEQLKLSYVLDPLNKERYKDLIDEINRNNTNLRNMRQKRRHFY